MTEGLVWVPSGGPLPPSTGRRSSFSSAIAIASPLRLHLHLRLRLKKQHRQQWSRARRCFGPTPTPAPTPTSVSVSVPYPQEEEEEEEEEEGSVTIPEDVRLNTLRLVESSMLAATVGLAYFLSNLLRIENYFGCFFPLPPLISSLRWGAAAGRKTTVATTMLLLVLVGPVKATSYLLMHGFLGLAMGTFWQWEINWSLSLLLCTMVRSAGAVGYILLTSWLLKENILSLIIMNAHTTISYVLAAAGINFVPSLGIICWVFTGLLFMNCGTFVFLVHVLYSIFIQRLGVRSRMSFPAWLKALQA